MVREHPVQPGGAARWWLLALLAFVVPGFADAAPAAPGWVVERVLIDPAIDNLEQRFIRDEPAFLNRLVTLAPPIAAMDDGTGPCTATRRRVANLTPAAALATRLYRRASYQRRHPRPADLGLRAGDRPVPVSFYACGNADGAAGGGRWNGAVSFPLPDGRLALIWHGEAVLVLAPLAAAFRPSFSCGRATSAAERTICADRSLAGWDRSVARAYAFARDGDEDFEPLGDLDALADAQRAWLASRDACGADHVCLRRHMSERVDALRRR